jgi:hypothetical protein
MNRSLTLLLTAILLSFGVPEAAGQDTLDLAPGQRVRVYDPGVQIATVMRVSRDTLTVVPLGTSRLVELPLRDLQRVDVDVGPGRGRGAVVGGLIGAAVGIGVFGLYSVLECPGYGVPTCFAIGALGGTVLGTPIGAISGAVLSGPRWETVYMRSNLP